MALSRTISAATSFSRNVMGAMDNGRAGAIGRTPNDPDDLTGRARPTEIGQAAERNLGTGARPVPRPRCVFDIKPDWLRGRNTAMPAAWWRP